MLELAFEMKGCFDLMHTRGVWSSENTVSVLPNRTLRANVIGKSKTPSKNAKGKKTSCRDHEALYSCCSLLRCMLGLYSDQQGASL